MSDQIAIVTGAGRGIGLEFTRQLVARGFHVVACARRPEKYDALTTLAEAGQASLQALDVSSPDSMTRAAAAIAEAHGHVDVIVNNAGVNSKSNPGFEAATSLRLGELTQGSLLQQFTINTIGPVLWVQALLPQLREGTRVLNVSSWLGSVSIKTSGGNYGYCASKSGLNMMNKALANDLKVRGVISVNFNPGWVRTDMGGERAKLSAEESVSGMLDTLMGLDLDDSGKFLQWDGSEHPW
ncbi:MAG: SDR family oxidoreductase [Bradymonadia bacterium]